MKKPNKLLGQNFLKNENIADKMISSLEINDNDVVVEIGGGLGALTNKLIKESFHHLYVYEIDAGLINGLKSISKNIENVTIICESILKADFEKIQKQGRQLKIIGSIPYYITSPIIHKLLESKIRAEKIVLLVQKEVAQKILANVPKANYWTNVIHGYDPSLIINVKADEFYPTPKVDSASILLNRNEIDEAAILLIGFQRWSKFLHHVFRSPRKMLNKAFSIEVLDKLGINPTYRPQNLTKADLFNMLRFTLPK